jgi:hypothetical protein
MVWRGREQNSYWLRGIVLEWTTTEVEVFCVDVGDKMAFPIEHIYEMPKTVAKHPICLARAVVSCMFLH